MYKMKKIVFLMVVVSLGLFSCKSNYTRIGDKNANYIPYYLKVYEADSLFIVGDYKRSYKILDSLFKKFEPVNMTGFYEYDIYISSCIMSENTKGIKKKFKTAYTKYGSNGIANCKKTAEVAKKINDKNLFSKDEKATFIAKYKKSLNLLLRLKIENMIIEDQRVRLNDTGNDSLDFFGNKHKKEIFEIFKQNGYPSIKKIGNENLFDKTANIELILIHQNTDVKKKMLPFLFDCLKKGHCTPSEYATIYDRFYWESSIESGGEKKQFYGTYLNSFNSAEFGFRVENFSKIDSIRESIGLEKKEYHYWRNKQIN
jgi:hypothetical protein